MFAAAVAILICMLPSCRHENKTKSSVAVTIAPQKYLLEKIVGDRYDVVTLLSANDDPETYDPTVTSLMSLQDSKAFFRVGTLGFELAALGKITESMPDMKIVNSSEGITLLEGTHGGPRGYDPHVWTSVRNARIMARNMYNAMVRLDPKSEKYFTRRYKALDHDLQQTDSLIAARLAGAKGHTFMMRHPSLGYFARDYGLKQLTLELNGKEPTPRELRHRLDEAAGANPDVFFIEKGKGADAARSVATNMNIPVVEISLLDYDWKQNMLKVADAIATRAADKSGEGK